MFSAPSPWQWFLDLVAEKRLAEVAKTGTAELIEQAEKYYKDLKEDEVVFTDPVFVEKKLNPEKSYWKVSYDCAGRGYTRPDITFRTYPLGAMIERNATPLAGPVQEVTTPGFYIDKETKQFHLVHADDGIEYLALLNATGYAFGVAKVDIEEFSEYNDTLHADGVVEISYPFVAGKIYLNKIKLVEKEEIVPTEEIQSEEVVRETVDETVEKDQERETVVEEQAVVQEEVVQEQKPAEPKQTPYYGKKNRK